MSQRTQVVNFPVHGEHEVTWRHTKGNPAEGIVLVSAVPTTRSFDRAELPKFSGYSMRRREPLKLAGMARHLSKI